ncbi:hypothetical protein EG68_12318 [Paragonimus skrjabini miyazakii]|uniref:Uncharacterized protein n=1 Tax=Paragonimus skrjabini miyazakii TaxID=59628 RepID=A0A8S9YD13_9TREM|nr:hypothetical protein EG68_12318 [Paragonimus skrjabini miyazakii]
MSVNELQDEVLSKCGSVSTSADGRELKLARIRIQQLELQLALKDKMEQCLIEYEEDVKRLNEQADSVISDHPARKPLVRSLPQSSTSPVKPHCCAMEQGCNERLDVQSYVNSLPDRAPSTKLTDPVLRICSEQHRESGSISLQPSISTNGQNEDRLLPSRITPTRAREHAVCGAVEI